MPEIIIRLHPDLADRILAAGPEGGAQLASLWRQAERAVRSYGRQIAYAPAVLPGGVGCAISVRAGFRGMVVEVDRPGTLIPGRNLVADRREPARRPAPQRR